MSCNLEVVVLQFLPDHLAKILQKKEKHRSKKHNGEGFIKLLKGLLLTLNPIQDIDPAAHYRAKTKLKMVRPRRRD